MFQGMKIPHGISNPVIRKVEDKYFIAFFGYSYSKENILTKKYNRPSQWIIVDITDGNLIKNYFCSEKDFSQESKEKLYSLDDPNTKKPTKEYFEIMDHLFDTVRASVMYGETIDTESYRAYFNSLLAITPKEYRVFYKALSIY